MHANAQMGRKNNSSGFLVIFTKNNFLVGINQIMLLVALCCIMSRLWAMSLASFHSYTRLPLYRCTRLPLYRYTRLPPVPLHSAPPCTAALGSPLYRCTRLPPVPLHSAPPCTATLGSPLYRYTRLPPVPLHSAPPCTATLGSPLYRYTRLPNVPLHSALSVFISDAMADRILDNLALLMQDDVLQHFMALQVHSWNYNASCTLCNLDHYNMCTTHAPNIFYKYSKVWYNVQRGRVTTVLSLTQGLFTGLLRLRP